MEINEVKIGDTVAFTHNKKKVMGKVIYRHDDSDNKKAERASLMGHVNVEIHGDKSYPVTVHVSKLKPAIKEETEMEEPINETVLDLIDHIDSGDNLAAEATLNNILQQRAQEVLDALKVEVASSMFNTEECSDCVEEEKKMKKKMEDDEEEDEEEDDEEDMNEALKGGQHKIDANKNGKVDAHDFKLLRGRKTAKTERTDIALAKRVEHNKKSMKEEAGVEESVAGLIGAGVGLAMAARGASRAAKTPLSGPRSGTKNYLKNFAKGMVGMKDKPKPKKNVKEEVELDEAKTGPKKAKPSRAGNYDTPSSPDYLGDKKRTRSAPNTWVERPPGGWPSAEKAKNEEVEIDEASYSAKKARAGKDIGKPGKMFGKIAKKASRKYGKERGAKIAGAVLAKLRKKGK